MPPGSERDTKRTNKQTNIGRTNIENGDPSTQKAPKGANNPDILTESSDNTRFITDKMYV